MTFLDLSFFGNEVRVWLLAALITIGSLAVFRLVQNVLIRRFSTFSRRTENHADDIIAQVAVKTRFWLLALLSLYLGSQVLALPPAADDWSGAFAFIVLMVQVAIWGSAFITAWLARYEKQHVEQDASRVTSMRALGFVLKLTLFSILLLLALDNVPGVEVTTLIASLGIGGVAVALAVQNIVADLFASLSIALDKPFVIGDFIVVGDFMGAVEDIGLKTTRLRSLSGEQLIFSNNDLVSSRIRNYKRMAERRVSFSVGVTYETPVDKLKRIPLVIQEIIEAQELTRFDRVHFKEFGDFSLKFEIVYYVLSPDYNLYMDIQQAINLAIVERFAEMGVAFAYPTQTLHLAKGTDGLLERGSLRSTLTATN